MAIKCIETCETCVYGTNNTFCSTANCSKCDMNYREAGVYKCKCTAIRWGDECPHFVKEPK